MKADLPVERWFWFDPPFHPNQSVSLHKQSDKVWRIDFQLGGVADPDIFKSICFFDPNGPRLELAAHTDTPEMMRKLDDVKWDRLKE